jgi:hypothetical protein
MLETLPLSILLFGLNHMPTLLSLGRGSLSFSLHYTVLTDDVPKLEQLPNAVRVALAARDDA